MPDEVSKNGHDIFRAVGEVTEITDPHPTNQKSACLFLSKHVLDASLSNSDPIPIVHPFASKKVFFK
jgi:hypothetical protein